MQVNGPTPSAVAIGAASPAIAASPAPASVAAATKIQALVKGNKERLWLSELPKCPITLDPLIPGSKKIKTLECGHQFYTHAIEQWTMHNSTCPLCRTQLEAARGAADTIPIALMVATQNGHLNVDGRRYDRDSQINSNNSSNTNINRINDGRRYDRDNQINNRINININRIMNLLRLAQQNRHVDVDSSILEDNNNNMALSQN